MSITVTLMVATDCETSARPVETVDWAELRALYCKGISLADLARDYRLNYSTVKNRAARESWSHTVAAVKEKVVQRATDDLTASATHWVRRIDKLMHTGLAHVEERVAKGHTVKTSELVQLMDAAEKANRIARLNYGLDKQGDQHAHIHLGVLAVGSREARSVGALIDVEAMPVAEAPNQSDTPPNQVASAPRE